MPVGFMIPFLIIMSWGIRVAMSFPAWWLWTACGLGRRYFAFLPDVWQSISMMHMFALFLLFAVVRTAVSKIELSRNS